MPCNPYPLFGQYGDRPRPAGRSAMHLHREAHDLEALGRQELEIVQLLEMRIADLAPGAVPLPDERSVAGRLNFAARMRKGRVPAPAIRAHEAHAALEQP